MGIQYHRAMLQDMPFIASATMDKAVCNYVLMDLPDLAAAVREIHRVLKPGGTFVAVISHPCFSCGPNNWHMPAADSPRPEDAVAKQVDHYFRRGARKAVWADFDPVTGFHRPLRDYWQVFGEAGFAVEGFEEPTMNERGLREAPIRRILRSQRFPYSCIFKLVNRG